MSSPFTKANLTVEDCEDAPDWFVDGPLKTINAFMIEADGALAGQLVRGENVLGKIFEGVRVDTHDAAMTVVADAAPFPLYLSTEGMPRLPKALWVGQVRTKSGTVPSSPVQPMWEMASDGKRVKIRLLTGLSLNETYTLTLLME